VTVLNELNSKLGRQMSKLQIKCGEVVPKSFYNQEDGQIPVANNNFSHTNNPSLNRDASKNNLDKSYMNYIAADLNCLKPLLDSYENEISNLEEALKSTKNEFESLEKTTDKLVSQNEELRKKLDNKCKEII
jgi:chromosome segregation ATPase